MCMAYGHTKLSYRVMAKLHRALVHHNFAIFMKSTYMKFSVDECMFVWCNSNPIVVRAEKIKKKKIKMFQNFAKNIGKVITITVV